MKKNHRTNLILEDYDSEFSYKKSKSNLNISFNRVAFIFFIFFIIFLIFSLKAFYFGTIEKKNKISHTEESDYRASIIDSSGNILAKTVITTNVGVNPNLVIDKKRLLINLKLIFPNKNFNILKKKWRIKNFFLLKNKYKMKN